jgi:long-subunit acyl-CoA synthetase (AMP-forming)
VVFALYVGTQNDASPPLLISNCSPQEYDFLGIYSRNRPEWVIGSIAAVIQSLTVIPLYNASGPNSLKTIVGKTRVSTVMTMGEHLRIVRCV